MDREQQESELEDLKALVLRWRDYIDGHHGVDEASRHGGYMAGLAICAVQLDEVIARIRADRA